MDECEEGEIVDFDDDVSSKSSTNVRFNLLVNWKFGLGYALPIVVYVLVCLDNNMHHTTNHNA